MDKLTVKIAFSKDDFREGLDYYIDKGGVLQKFTRDGIDCSGSIDTEFYVDKDAKEETLIVRIQREYERLWRGPLGDEQSSNKSYVYVYSEYDELLSVYKITDEDDMGSEFSIKGCDIIDLYKSCGLSEEEIKIGKRALSVIAISDGIQELNEAIKHGNISLAVVFLSAMLFLLNNDIARSVGALTGSASVFTSALSSNEMSQVREKILYHCNLLQGGLEPDQAKREVLKKDYEEYAKTELKALNIR